MVAGQANTNQQNLQKQIQKPIRNFILHIHPYRIPEANLRFTHTWGLGGMAVTLILLQIFTGVLMRFQYNANPRDAFDSILRIQDGLLFGTLVRNIHHWSGMFLIIISFLHLIRVFLSGAFTAPRHLKSRNYCLGEKNNNDPVTMP
jgi:quinol-cytochrome oxidoreductase complex cytochrome b subunit